MYAGHLRAHKFGFYLSAYEVKTKGRIIIYGDDRVG